MKHKVTVPKEIYEIAERFRQGGYECFLVGGAVRDQLLGRDAKDWDITTNALPKQVMGLFKHVIPTGIKHGTVTVIYKDYHVETTTYRVDGKYTDGRRPDQISFSPSIREDLKRRDFTINSIAWDLINRELFDPNKGLKDLEAGIIRAIGKAEERFDEDGLRSIRACRFAAQLNFKVDEETLKGITKTHYRIPDLSKERIYEELMKIMGTDTPSLSFKLFRDTGLLKILFPELAACIGVGQKGSHHYDVFEHSIYACDGVPPTHKEVRIAALLHDTGKPGSMGTSDSGEVTFHNHEKLSEKLAAAIMQRYRFPVKSMKKIGHLIGLHMFHYEPAWTDSAVRRLIARVGRENLEDLFLMRQGDIWGTARLERNNERLDALKERIGHILEEENAFSIKDLHINGSQLHEQGGIPKSRKMGLVLEFLLEAVLDDPTLNYEEKLLEMGVKYYESNLES
ncbi:MAG: CCA tRNA nucleotidyltransferase [Spirochaetales bacterium]|nr:CCA tRNA nucleotidyltransferase [Spirochaetales bacterium]